MRFRIEFKHAETGKAEYLHEGQYTYFTRGAAQAQVDHFNDTNNPAWNGTFSVVEIVEGIPA